MRYLNRSFRIVMLLVLMVSLSACMYWIRAYQVYQQMDEFDRYFSVETRDEFILHFKQPILLSQDFVALSKLYASRDDLTPEGRRWRYWFRKVDGNNQLIKPEIKFYSDLHFDHQNKLMAWSFSSLFLAIAPSKFLEASLRSIGGAHIDKEKKQLKANSALLEKIADDLPKKPTVLSQLGEPFEVIDDGDEEIYIFRFLLETYRIESGYEDRALNEVKISFDKKTQELVRMAGRFAGLKVAINYRKFLDETQEATD